MEQKDNFSEKNYFSLVLEAFSLLASGRCIVFRQQSALRHESAVRQVHCGRSEVNKRYSAIKYIHNSMGNFSIQQQQKNDSEEMPHF